MSDENESLEKKYQILLQKYKTLRKNHRKLAGVALQLVEALEAFIKSDVKPDVRGVLLSCSTIYPGLVKDPTDETMTETVQFIALTTTQFPAQGILEGLAPQIMEIAKTSKFKVLTTGKKKK